MQIGHRSYFRFRRGEESANGLEKQIDAKANSYTNKIWTVQYGTIIRA